jgi:DUF917 family protein
LTRARDAFHKYAYQGEIVADAEIAKAAVYGGCLLGGGGGGWIQDGLARSSLALSLGQVRIVPIDSLDEDSIIITASAVGASGSKDRHVLPIHFVQAIEEVVKVTGTEPDAIVTCEIGATGSVNGWLQSLVLGIPVVDAPWEGRAHPTAAMGSGGLWFLEGYESVRSAVGGDPSKGKHVKMVVRGSFRSCANMVRLAAVQAGGVVAVGRDPLPASFIRKNAACGSLTQAISLGQAYLKGLAKGRDAAIEEACSFLGAEIVYAGTVTSVDLEQRGGFDIGTIQMDNGICRIVFWNEYMTLEIGGERKATFPDLVITFDEAGTPLISAGVKPGQRLTIAHAPKERLILGTGLTDPRCYEDAERATGQEIIRYSFS